MNKVKKSILPKDPTSFVTKGQKIIKFVRVTARTATPVLNAAGGQSYEGGKPVVKFTNNPGQTLFSCRLNSAEKRNYRRKAA